MVPSKTGGGWEVEPRAGGSASFAAAAAMATHELGVAGRGWRPEAAVVLDFW